MKVTIDYIRFQVVPPVSFGLFVAVEGFVIIWVVSGDCCTVNKTEPRGFLPSSLTVIDFRPKGEKPTLAGISLSKAGAVTRAGLYLFSSRS